MQVSGIPGRVWINLILLVAAAVEALIGFAQRRLHASDLHAGVTHGNRRSMLERLGFRPAASFER